ncbi:MAG: DUF4836 family protein [Porphyromonadaceae bacterium]|nr:DUF4836 family protein [Porphyromonadaceae bacterium]
MRKSLESIVLAMIMVFTLFSCAKKESLATAIPKDTSMVIKIDIKSLAKKSNYNFMNNSVIKGYVEMMKASLNDEQKKLLEEFVANPNSVGINILEDMFMFYGNNGDMGLVMSVNNSKKLYDNILTTDPNFKEMIKVDKGIYTLDLGRVSSIAWDNKRFVAHINYTSMILGSSDIKVNTAEQYLHLKKDQSFYASDNYKKINDNKNDISIYYSAKQYFQFYNNILASSALSSEDSSDQELLDMIAQLSDAMSEVAYNMIGSCNFENGKIVCKTNMFFDTPEAEAKYNNLKLPNASLTGDLNKYVSSNGILYFAAHINGKDIVADISTLKADNLLNKLSEKLNINLRDILLAFDGDLIFGLNRINTENDEKPIEFSLFAKVDSLKAKTLLDSLVLKDNKTIVKITPNNYSSNRFLFGLQNGVLYFTNDSTDYVNFGKGGIANTCIDKIKEQPLYLGGDLRILKDQLINQINIGNPKRVDLAKEALGLISTFETKQDDKLNGTFEINFTDTKTNSLEQIFKLIDKAINGIM